MRFHSPLAILFLPIPIAAAQGLPLFDFTRGETHGFTATHAVAPLTTTPEGLLVRITETDPYFTSPPLDLPAGQLLWLKLRGKSQEEGSLQVFYFQHGATEEASVRVPMRAGAWEDLVLPLPAMGKGWRIRIDPPADVGQFVLASLAFESRTPLVAPAWPKPQQPTVKADAPTIRGGLLTLRHGAELGGWILSVNGKDSAIGFNRSLIGYVAAGQQRWLDLAKDARTTVQSENDAVIAKAIVTDSDGGRMGNPAAILLRQWNNPC